MVFMASSITQDYGNSMFTKNRDFSSSCEKVRAPASAPTEDLVAQLKQKELDNNMLQFKLLETERELETAKRDASELKLQLEAAQSSPQISEDQTLKIAELTAALKESQDSLDQRTVKVLELEDQLTASRQEMEALTQRVSQSEAGREALQKIVAEKDSEITKRQQEIESLKKEIDDLKRERAGSSAQAAAIASAKAENNVAVLNQLLSQVNVGVRIDLDKFLLSKEEEIKKLRSDVAKGLASEIQLQQQVISYQQLVAELKKKIEELEKVIAERDQQVIEKAEELKKIEREIEEATKANELKLAEEKKKNEEALNEQRCKHEDSIAELKKEIEGLIKDKKQIALKLETLDPKKIKESESLENSEANHMAINLMAQLSQQMQMSNMMFQQQMQQMVMMNGGGNSMMMGMNNQDMNSFLMMSMMQKWHGDYMQFGAFQNNSQNSLLGDFAAYRNSQQQFWNFNPYVEHMYQSQFQNPYGMQNQNPFGLQMQMTSPSLMTRGPAQNGMFGF